MDFNDLDKIKKAGFAGFQTMAELFIDQSGIPDTKGIYLVLHLDKESPDFLPIGTGGYFKGDDPNISIEELKANWIENTIVVYIGKAGGNRSSATLKKRLRQYVDFGKGKNIGHYGGRLIWQLANSNNLIVCWKTLPDEDPRTIEKKLIQEFKDQFKARPFANLTG